MCDPVNSNGGLYSGPTHHGMAHGQGEIVWPQRPKSSTSYAGTLRQGLRHGYGKLEILPGSSFIGSFVDDYRDGPGLQHVEGSMTIAGHFSQGKLVGSGSESHLNGREVQGEYKDDVLCGKGTVHYEDGSSYIGQFHNGLRHGQGRMHWRDGDAFHGSYVDDLKHGQGCYTWADGRKYKGNFAHGYREEVGCFYWPDGSKFEGHFKKDQRYGSGTLEHADGSKDIGSWRGAKLLRLLSQYGKHDEMDGGGLTQSSWQLMAAAEHGNLVTLRALLEEGHVHVDVCDNRGVNSLLLAAAAGHEAAVALLLDKGAHINHVTDEGVSALVVAYRGYRGLEVPGLMLKGGHSDPQSMEHLYDTLLRRGADTNIASHPEPVLLTAVSLADVRIALLLLQHNTNPNVVSQADKYLHSPLLRAVYLMPSMPEAGKDFLKIVQALIAKRCDLNAVDVEGNTACHLACRSELCAQVLEMVLIAGAHVNVTNNNGMTPLAIAVQAGLVSAVERLLRANADPNQMVGPQQDSLLNLALLAPDDAMPDADRLAIVELLINAKANVTLAVPTPTLSQESIPGTVMDTLHNLYLRHVDMPTHRRESVISGVASMTRRLSVSVEIEAIQAIILDQLQAAAFSNADVGIKFCVECGRSARQKLLAFGNSETLRFCSERCKMRSLNGPNRRELLSALSHDDPERWRLIELGDETPLVWQSDGQPELIKRPNTCPPDVEGYRPTGKARRATRKDGSARASLAQNSQVLASGKTASWQRSKRVSGSSTKALRRGTVQPRPLSTVMESIQPLAVPTNRKPSSKPQTGRAKRISHQPTSQRQSPVTSPKRVSNMDDIQTLQRRLSGELRLRANRVPSLAMTSRIVHTPLSSSRSTKTKR